ncbi:hypothetical protein KSZ28_18360 [Bacteroides salyersiae]|jgi:hypothetical protein|uniref:hypothetical protein n=1 Tax=Bacteroides salyersiae TaxID=291644 RepID=UPI001C392BFF|nr:hypothetical protein [Bacteroides salyersiae]MBV4205667.1 hypothetical protein [Bacteroides salyersiae]MCB6650848.1 hypothetical protein [Bacteroides salyersiae]
MTEPILELVSKIASPGFFITAEVSREGTTIIPEDIEAFIGSKLRLIHQGISSRKFVYQKSGWRIIFTFFPTDKVVDEKYALKNKVLFKKLF